MTTTAKNAKNSKAGRFAITGASAVVALGALGLMIGQGHDGYGEPLGSQMTTGVTITPSVGPDNGVLPMAVPSITGPAPLPSEEQGLPG